MWGTCRCRDKKSIVREYELSFIDHVRQTEKILIFLCFATGGHNGQAAQSGGKKGRSTFICRTEGRTLPKWLLCRVKDFKVILKRKAQHPGEMQDARFETPASRRIAGHRVLSRRDMGGGTSSSKGTGCVHSGALSHVLWITGCETRRKCSREERWGLR